MTAVKNTQPTTARCEEKIIHEDKVRLAEKHLVDGLTATKLARTYQALADPTRVRIISALSITELCVCDIAALLGITQSAISHQLRQMRDLRLVRTRKEGRIVYYALDDEHIKDLFNLGFEHLKHD